MKVDLEAKLIRLALKEYNKLDSVIIRITERKPTKSDRNLIIGELFDRIRFYKLLCEKYWKKAYGFYIVDEDSTDFYIPEEIVNLLEDVLQPIWDKENES